LKAVLAGWRDLAAGVRHFSFVLPEVDQFPFTAGQFVTLSDEIEGKQISRAYSICSAPDGNTFELCLNLVEGGLLSPRLFELKRGDSIQCKGPNGFFVMRNPPSDSVMIAAGTGIAPFRGILRHALHRYPELHFTLLFGTRRQDTILYRDEWEQMESLHKNFRFWPSLSRSGADWQGRCGHVQQHLDEALAGRTDVDVYICGLKAMVDDVRQRLKAKGFDRKSIIYEKYD
jgi:ferredoxin-NADP reductase